MFLKMHETFALFKHMNTDETFFGLGPICGVSLLTACVYRLKLCSKLYLENSCIE